MARRRVKSVVQAYLRDINNDALFQEAGDGEGGKLSRRRDAALGRVQRGHFSGVPKKMFRRRAVFRRGSGFAKGGRIRKRPSRAYAESGLVVAPALARTVHEAEDIRLLGFPYGIGLVTPGAPRKGRNRSRKQQRRHHPDEYLFHVHSMRYRFSRFYLIHPCLSWAFFAALPAAPPGRRRRGQGQ